MKLDCHVHIMDHHKDTGDMLLEKMAQAGISGGLVTSLAPASFKMVHGEQPSNEERLDFLMNFCSAGKLLFPFYWIDPMEKDMFRQVDRAIEAGVDGFKVICNAFYPGDGRALALAEYIAYRGKPMLFHSGILYDNVASSPYNRPVEFEPLLYVDGLRFAMAHISWPWCDECIAVYGKYASTQDNIRAKLYIDTTPGTPPVYRREALTRLFTFGEPVRDNVMFGTDCHAENYNVRQTKAYLEQDEGIYAELELPPQDQEKIFSGNLLAFLGKA
nr:amidohydrolase family protein [bacterium]